MAERYGHSKQSPTNGIRTWIREKILTKKINKMEETKIINVETGTDTHMTLQITKFKTLMLDKVINENWELVIGLSSDGIQFTSLNVKQIDSFIKKLSDAKAEIERRNKVLKQQIQ